MKQGNLENFVRQNKGQFDIHTPSPQVWQSLQQQLDKKKRPEKRLKWLRIAAVFAVFLAGSGTLAHYFFGPANERMARTADPEIQELIEAEAYYAHQVSGKLNEIRKCYNLMPELQMDVENDLNELEGMYNTLKRDLRDNIANKEVIEAMIENNRIRLKIVDDVLNKIDC